MTWTRKNGVSMPKTFFSVYSLLSKLWGRGECQCIGAHDNAGGVAFLWNPLKIHHLWWMSSKSSIFAIASSVELGETILLSNIYAPIDFPCKQLLWSHINFSWSLATFFPWIITGDFSDIIELDEKKGGIERLEPSAFLLRDNIFALNLIDIKPRNGQFT
jgi:hypothetical protein